LRQSTGLDSRNPEQSTRLRCFPSVFFLLLAQVEYHALPARVKARILLQLCNDLLDVRSVRAEVDRREAGGQWTAGAFGEGGAFEMRPAEERAKGRAAAADRQTAVAERSLRTREGGAAEQAGPPTLRFRPLNNEEPRTGGAAYAPCGYRGPGSAQGFRV
jgi:hypothetical protein